MDKCVCGKTITKFNVRSYKGFCCKRFYIYCKKRDGKKSVDSVQASNERVKNKLNNIFN